MSTNDMYFADNRTHTQRMAEALLANTMKPNPSWGGALGNALAMGLMGLMERGDDQQKEGAMDRSIGSLANLSPASPDQSIPPRPAVAAPADVSPVQPKATVQALMGTKDANSFYDAVPGPTQSAAPIATDVQQQPVIDRSQIGGDLNENAPKIAAMLKGEGGNKMIQAETLANRMLSRGIPASQALLSVAEDPRKGYYATDTYKRQPSPAEIADVRANIIPSLVGGSDVGGQTLGFSPTGNASGQYAVDRQNRGIYADSAWPSGVPGKGEMYALERPDAGKLPMNPMAQPLLQEAQRRAGVMPNPGTQPNLAPTTQPYAPPTAPAAPPRPVAPQMPQPQALPRDPQMEDAIRQYQSMKPGDPNKQRIYEQIQRMQAELRTRQLDLSKTDYELQRRNQLEGQQQDAQRSANEASQTRIKQTPTSEEIIKERDRQIGKGQVSELARRAVDNVLKLSEMGSMPDTDRTGIAGKLKNIGAGIDSTEYLGQPLGRIEGSPQQSLRDELTGTGRRLAQSVAQASGMSAKQQDSNVELQSMLSSVGSATGDKWSNLAKIYQIDKLYGNGDLARSLPPEVVQRLEAGSAAAGRPNAAHVDDLVKKYAR